MNFFYLLLLSSFSLQLNAQDNSIVVNKDRRIDILAEKQAYINYKAKTAKTRGYRPGYRLQVYNSQNREAANTMKANLLRAFPEHKTYLLYQAPNFRIRIGNFLSQKDASSLRKRLAEMYPGTGIFIVRDRVEYNPPDEEMDEK